MYLTGYQTDLLGRVIATLAEPHDEDEIRAQVGALMLELLGAQHYASYVWDSGQRRFDGGVRINMDPGNLLQYERHYQYHDPITPTLQQHRRAVRVSDVMPQCELVRTEFFNDFLAKDGLYWGINLYAWLGDTNLGDMRIWRDRRRENFSNDDLQVLDLIGPALVAALSRARGADATASPMKTLLVDSAQPALSPRELEVARLASCGMSDKEIAKRLGLAITTVRTHLDHAFRKLQVDNRMKLVQRLGL